MHHTRKLAAVTASLIAAMALMATTASATNAIEVTKADGTTHCPALDAGGCATHAAGEVTLFFHIFGFEGAEAKCRAEARGVIDEDGNGRTTGRHVDSDDHDVDCSENVAPPCGGSLPWVGSAENDADGVVRGHADVCIDPAESGTCAGEFIGVITETGTTTETQTSSATDLRIGSSFCEATATGTTEAAAPEGEEVHIKSF